MKVSDLPPRTDEYAAAIDTAIAAGRVEICEPAPAANPTIRARRKRRIIQPDVRKLTGDALQLSKARNSAAYAERETRNFLRRDRRARSVNRIK